MPHVAWEYTWTGRQLTIMIWVPGIVPPGAVEAVVQAAWPGAACTTGPATPPVPLPAGEATGGALVPAMPDHLPLGVDHKVDPLRPLVAAGAQIRDREHACIQVLARPAPPRRARAARRTPARLRRGGNGDPVARTAGGLARVLVEPVLWLVEVFLPGPPRRITTSERSSSLPSVVRDPVQEREARAVLDKTTSGGPLYEVAIRYAVTTNVGNRERVRRRLRGLAHTVASAFAAHTAVNKLHRLRLPNPATAVAGRRLGRGFLLAVDELKWLAALPTDLAVPGLDRARAKPVPAPVAVPSGGRGTRVLGVATVGGHSVALPVADARQHIHLVGKTGTGKIHPAAQHDPRREYYRGIPAAFADRRHGLLRREARAILAAVPTPAAGAELTKPQLRGLLEHAGHQRVDWTPKPPASTPHYAPAAGPGSGPTIPEPEARRWPIAKLNRIITTAGSMTAAAQSVLYGRP
jgi:hypothetical protein